MKSGVKMAGVGLLGLVAGGAAATALAQGTAADPDRARIEQIVREYILEHPEIIPEAVEKLQQRELGKVVAQNRAALEKPWHGAWEGAADADVTLVEFYDYACTYCRASLPDIDRLLAEDKKLKVVYRELPVLGEDSVTAAKASLAAAKGGQAAFAKFHDSLFGAGRPTAPALAAARRAAGVGGAETPDLQAEIDSNYRLAQALNANGTPLFVIGDKVVQGAIGYDALKEAIAEARAAK